MSLTIFCVFHKTLPKIEDKRNLVFYGVNEKIEPSDLNVIYEYELKKYNPFFQECGYAETSALIHCGLNDLCDTEYIGFCHYSKLFNQHIFPPLHPNICICVYRCNHNFDETSYFHCVMKDYFVTQYNLFFGDKIKLEDFSFVGAPLMNMFIIHNTIYKKCFPFWQKIAKGMFPFCKYISKPWTGDKPQERDTSLMMEVFVGATLKYQNINIVSSDNAIIKHDNEKLDPNYKKYRHMPINYSNSFL